MPTLAHPVGLELLLALGLSARKTSCSELDLRSYFARQFASVESETGRGSEVTFYKQFERVVRILWTVFQKMTEARVFPQRPIDK